MTLFIYPVTYLIIVCLPQLVTSSNLIVVQYIKLDSKGFFNILTLWFPSG